MHLETVNAMPLICHFDMKNNDHLGNMSSLHLSSVKPQTGIKRAASYLKMKKIEIETILDIPMEQAWEEALKPSLLEFIALTMIRFKPVMPPEFPKKWEKGEYKVSMYFKGVIPLGQQVIRIEFPDCSPPCRILRDNGYGKLIKKWDHWIIMEPTESGTHYMDRVYIDAGLITPFVKIFAKVFYKHRQKRWKILIANKFDYSSV